MLVLRQLTRVPLVALLTVCAFVTACDKVEVDGGTKVDDDCRAEVVDKRVASEDQAIVEFTVKNTSDVPLTITVTAGYKLGGILVAEGGGNFSEVTPDQQARFRIRPSTPLGPGEFDCVEFTTRTKAVGARTIRRCEPDELCL